MYRMRKLHNSLKKQLIESVCTPESLVLDVGCGRGGDVMKWTTKKPIVCVDPDEESLKDAISRQYPRKVQFIHGDICSAPLIEYDIICYNFSFQYVFKTRDLFEQTIREIVKRTKIGSKFMGVIPDSMFILSQKEPKYKDQLGNYFLRNTEKTGYGDFGETLWVCVKDTVYYENDEPKPEPIAYKDIIIQHMRDAGFELTVWKPFVSYMTGYITDMYSEFIFTRVQ